jgi:aldose 1-epimerase
MPDNTPVTLRDPSSSLTAAYVPSAGMICTSLADDGVEFLGQRRGVEAYIAEGKTMGIPILYPWANRLGADEYDVDGTRVTLTPGEAGVRADEHGAPIHGVLAADPGWDVVEQNGHRLVASLDWGATPRLMESFPFPHVLTMSVTLADRRLTVATTVTPSTDTPVPLCYGYHPYLTVPGVPREEWVLQTPAMRRLPTDDRGIPTGEHAEWAAESEPLGRRELDDGFDEVPEGAVFALSGGDRRIEVTYVRGYPAAQLFAPGSDAVVGIEPMAAPTDALRRGGYRTATPGEGPHSGDTATFSITVA